VLDQRAEGACVGFALATVINVALAGQRGGRGRLPAARPMSSRMLYEIGRRYDDSIQIYQSSLLTCVADHLESPAQRVALLGIRRDPQQASVPFVTRVAGAASTGHGDFDDAGHEVEATLADIASARW
jgi:hypothetical protein